MTDESLSSSEGSAAGTEEGAKPAETEQKPAAGSEVAGETTGDGESGLGEQDTELGFIQDADINEGSEPEGSDGFEGYDKDLDAAEPEVVADDEKAFREVESEVEAEGGEEKPEGDSEAAEKETEQEAAPEKDEAPEGEKFEFMGEKFDSKEAAEQNSKSLRGQFKSLQEQITELRTANNSYELAFQRQEQAKAEGTGAEKQPQGSAGAEPDKKSESSGGDAVAEIITKGIDWEMVKQIREQQGEDAALQWSLYEMGTKLSERFDSQLKASTSEFEKFQEVNRAQRMTADTFTQARNFVDDKGQPLYPEFQDMETTKEVVELWKRLDLPPEKMHSPAGVYFAILAHRDLKGTIGSGEPKATAETPPAAGAEVDPVVAAVENAGQAGSGVVPGSDRVPGPKPKIPKEDRAAQAILDAGRGEDPELGFTF